MKKKWKKILEDKSILQAMILSGEFDRTALDIQKRLRKLGVKRFIKELKKNGVPVKEVIVMRHLYDQWEGAVQQNN